MISLPTLLPRFHISSHLVYSSTPMISPFPSLCKQSQKSRKHTAVRKGGFGDGGGDPVQDSSLFDEDGVVQDMDGYLNSLSLEYDSVWDTKPSWCQPWTIIVTGIGVTTCSWLILHSIVASSLVGALICGWWYIFLYSYPKAYSDMIAERRKSVTSGVEDTYGTKTK